MTVADLQHLELAYAPPYNAAKDIVNQAGFVATNLMSGLAKFCYPADMYHPKGNQLIVDVRTPQELKDEGCVPGAVNIPVDDLRGRSGGELPKDKHLLVYCRVGMRGHVAAMMLQNMGYHVSNLTGGYRTWQAVNSRL